MDEDLNLKDNERQECECWSRVMGYLRPKSQYNKGKVAEFEERKPYEESIINEHL